MMWARSICKHTVGVSLILYKESNRASLWNTVHRGFMVRAFSSVPKPIAKEWTKLNLGNQEPYTFTSDQEKYLTKGDENTSRKLKELQLQLYLHQQQGQVLPGSIQLKDVEVMLDLSQESLKKYLDIIAKRYLVELRDKNLKLEQRRALELVRDERKDKIASVENPWLSYNLFNNALFCRFSKSAMNKFYDAQAVKGLQFGQKIVIDCSFDEYMSPLEIKETANQIMAAYVSNRRSLRPFAIHFCNVNENSRVMKQLRKLNPYFEVDAAVCIHSCSYHDVFNRDKLVYISHDAKQSLQYNPNHIYILGGIVERMLGRKLCLKKARKERVTCVSLPVKNYIQWKGPMFLAINHYMDILLEVKNTRDWYKALSNHVPRRKVQGFLKTHSGSP